MSLETQIANLVAATNQLTGEVSGKMASITQTVDAKKAELDAWKNDAQGEFALPFDYAVTVGGDAAKYYPVPVVDTISRRLGRLVIFRGYNDPHPAALGESHVAGLTLELAVRADGWNDFNLTRIDYFGFAYHNAVARIEKHMLGRVIWLRGGGMEYRFLSDFELSPGRNVMGTINMTPIMLANTQLYPDSVVIFPTVSPLSEIDALFENAITTQSTI